MGRSKVSNRCCNVLIGAGGGIGDFARGFPDCVLKFCAVEGQGDIKRFAFPSEILRQFLGGLRQKPAGGRSLQNRFLLVRQEMAGSQAGVVLGELEPSVRRFEIAGLGQSTASFPFFSEFSLRRKAPYDNAFGRGTLSSRFPLPIVPPYFFVA